MVVVDAWDVGPVERVKFSNAEGQAIYDLMRNADPKQQRIAGLVALVEELLDECEEVATGKRLDLSGYRARLAELKGEG